MNTKRIVLGGLIAAVIIILSAITMVPVVGNEMDLALAKFNLPPLSTGDMAYFVVVSLVLGFAVVWLYAVMLPRLKSHTKTAITAALFMWLIGYFFPNISMVVYGFMPVKLTIIGTVWGFFELLIASLIGTRFYKENLAP
jgi:hypothetical protein